MSPPPWSPTDPTVASILRGVAGGFESAFPGRARGFYLIGSHALGTAQENSDLDTYVVLRDDVELTEVPRIRGLARSYSRLARIEIDIAPLGEDELRRFGHLSLKREGQCFHGEDLLDDVPWMADELGARRAMHRAIAYLAALRPGRALDFPLGYPDPEAELLGYDRVPRVTVDGGPTPSLRGLVHACGKTATGVICVELGKAPGDRASSLSQARKVLGDAWGSHVEEVEHWARERWRYAIPSDPEARETLNRLCRRTLDFENRFLARYRDFLLAELESPPVEEWLTVSQAVRLVGLDPRLLTELRSAGQLETRQEGPLEWIRIADLHGLLALLMLGRVSFDDPRFPPLVSRRAEVGGPLVERLIQRLSQQPPFSKQTTPPDERRGMVPKRDTLPVAEGDPIRQETHR